MTYIFTMPFHAHPCNQNPFIHPSIHIYAPPGHILLPAWVAPNGRQLTVSRAAQWTTTKQKRWRGHRRYLISDLLTLNAKTPNHVRVGLAQWLVFFRSFFQNLMGTENTQQSYSVNLGTCVEERLLAMVPNLDPRFKPSSPFAFMMACVRRLFSMKGSPREHVETKRLQVFGGYGEGLANGDHTIQVNLNTSKMSIVVVLSLLVPPWRIPMKFYDIAKLPRMILYMCCTLFILSITLVLQKVIPHRLYQVSNRCDDTILYTSWNTLFCLSRPRSSALRKRMKGLRYLKVDAMQNGKIKHEVDMPKLNINNSDS